MSLQENLKFKTMSEMSVEDLINMYGSSEFFGVKLNQNVYPLTCQLKLGADSIIDKRQPPFSMIMHKGIQIETLTFLDNFSETDYFGSTDEKKTRIKMKKLSEILNEMNAEKTITDLSFENYDVKLYIEFMKRLKNLKSLRVNRIEPFIDEKTTGMHITTIKSIVFDKCYNLKSSDVDIMLQMFPNTKEIYVKSDNNLDKTIFEDHAPLIKTICDLKDDSLKSIMDFPDLKINDFGSSWASRGPIAIEFIQKHPEIQSCSLSIMKTALLDRPYKMITDLSINVEDFDIFDVLKWTPNIKSLALIVQNWQCCHQSVEMKHITEVQISGWQIKCMECFSAVLQSIKDVKSFTLNVMKYILSIDQMKAISKNLKNLESLKISYSDVQFSNCNFLDDWPLMPKLTVVELSQAGIVTERGIHNLKEKCPNLHSIMLNNRRGTIGTQEIVKFVVNAFPDIRSIAITDGGHDKIEKNELHKIFADGKGWRLQQLEFSCDIRYNDILKVFRKLKFLEILTCYCKNDTVNVKVSRRIFYETDVLKKYSFHSFVNSCEESDDDYDYDYDYDS